MNPKTFRRIIIGVVLVIIVLFGAVFAISAIRQEPVIEFVSRGATLFPFGPRGTVNQNVQTTESGQDEGPEQNQTQTIETEPDRLRRVTETPVTGFVAFDTFTDFVREFENAEGETETETLEILVPKVRYNERSTGYVFEASLGNEITEEQITQTDIPGAQEVYFDALGNNIALRFFNKNNRSLETFVATIPEKEEPPQICPIVFNEELKSGSKGVQVTELQKFLNYELGLAMTPDGSFGSGLRTALVSFQEKESLEATGVFDEITRNAANLRCQIALQEIAIAERDPVDLEGGFFAENLLAFDQGPGENQFLYTLSQSGATFLISSNTSGSQRRQLFDSSFSEWLPDWVNSGTVSLNTRASAFAPGYLYHLNTTNGELERVLGDINGLTSLTSPNGLVVLFSESRGTNLSTSVYDKLSKDTRSIGLSTLPEKCAWRKDSVTVYCAVPTFIPNGDYPDDWYKGVVTFNDSIWQINTTTAETELLISPVSAVGQSMDIILPALNPSESHLFFVDQNTNELWSLAL